MTSTPQPIEIKWTHEMYLRFKDAYGQAVSERVTDFKFDGNKYDTKYAMYLIAYLSSCGFSSNI